MAKLKDISKMYISSVTDQYDAAERLVRSVVEDEIERGREYAAQFEVGNPRRRHTLSEVDLLEAWLNGETRMVAERRVYDAPKR